MLSLFRYLKFQPKMNGRVVEVEIDAEQKIELTTFGSSKNAYRINHSLDEVLTFSN